MRKSLEVIAYNPEKIKRVVLSANLKGSKDALLKEFNEKLPAYLNGTQKESSEAMQGLETISNDLMRIFESETHIGLSETFDKRYRALAVEMTTTMIEEYACRNEAERALVALAVNAYIRVIDNSRRLNNQLEGSSTTPTLNTFIAILSKQIDRANRQYISAITTLQHIKAPKVELSIKANTAFVSQNQQVNIKQDEINATQ